jgi:hypothetical protein
MVQKLEPLVVGAKELTTKPLACFAHWRRFGNAAEIDG